VVGQVGHGLKIVSRSEPDKNVLKLTKHLVP
jgi:hypothetical protein